MSTAAPAPSNPPSQFDLPEAGDRDGIGPALRDYVDRVRGGEIGSLPAIIGIVALIAIFGILESETFLNKNNFANLLNQGAAITVLAMGLVFVLLLGEIDLSSGFTAGISAAILGVTLTEKGWPWPLTILVALLCGAVIGFVISALVARLGIPSFVVTLAFFLALQGGMLLIIGEGGTIPIRSEPVLKVMNENMPVVLGWLFALSLIGGFALMSLMAIRKRRKAGLPAQSMSVWAAKVAMLAIPVLIAAYLLNQERQRATATITIEGIPWVVPLVAVLTIGLAFLLTRTAFGRHVYAVGGNAEAARRAGINVANIKMQCFIIGSTMAAVAGILLASRDNSVSPTTGGAQTLLYAVGAAVIGGTSLFGGRGRVTDAVTGGLVVAIIANGLPLVTQKSGTQFIVNGLVLLVAAAVDAVSRRRAAVAGR